MIFNGGDLIMQLSKNIISATFFLCIFFVSNCFASIILKTNSTNLTTPFDGSKMWKALNGTIHLTLAGQSPQLPIPILQIR